MISDDIKEEVTLDVEGSFPGVEVKYVNVSLEDGRAYANYLIVDRGGGEEAVVFDEPLSDLDRMREVIGEWLAA